MIFGGDFCLIEMLILEDLSVMVSCSLQGIKDADWVEETTKGVKLLGLVKQSSLRDDIPPSKVIFGSAGGLGLNTQGPNVGCAGIFAGGGKFTGRPDSDVTV